MPLLLWEYGSMPTSVFFLEFELPNLIVIQLLSNQVGKTKEEGREVCYLQKSLSHFLPQLQGSIRRLFIYILLHHVQTNTLEKRDWLSSSSLNWWKVLLSGGSSQSARASEISIKWKWTKQCLCGKNQTSHGWQ